MYCSKKQKIPPFFKAITTHFKNKIVFGHIMGDKDGKNPICEQELKVEEFPALIYKKKKFITISSDII